jgi:hypothetical protein
MVTDKTAEAVGVASGVVSTQLKQGVNERVSRFRRWAVNLCRYLSTTILDVRLQKFAYGRRCHCADLSGYFQAIFK